MLLLALGVSCIGLNPIIGAAQAYPERPIRMVVPFPAAGIADVLARAIGQRLTDALGRPTVIDNRPGAAATLGANITAKAAPDGYTLLMGTSGSHVMTPNIIKTPYDPIRDFLPITMVATSVAVLVVNPSLPAKSVRELIELAKSRPGKLNMASFGTGSASHLYGELFKVRTGIDMTHVPYKGSPAALVDLMSGQVQVMFDNFLSVLPHVKTGKLRALGVTSAKRSVEMPDWPAIAETVTGYDAIGWFGIFAPAGTRRNIVALLNREIVKILNSADFRKLFADQGLDIIGDTPEHFAETVRKDLAKWEVVVKTSGARFE